MILRAMTLAGGVTGAAALSQFPEFSQQYVQRLGGAVDALSEVVADFDASASAEGLSRHDALAQMTGTDFLDARQNDMRTTFARHERLSAQLQSLDQTGPFMRAYHVAGADGQVARAAWVNFQPAVPLNAAGAIFAGAGFVFGSGTVSLLTTITAGLFRRRKPKGA
ncbi:MAG: DUF2937 family protein [Pseudomonadota bacterium]